MVHQARLLLWRALALTSLALGLVGVVVPGLPTVPFLLLAAWAGAKSWPALERWLVEHPRWGEAIRQWREKRAIPRRAKWAASAMMLASAVILQFTTESVWLRIGVPVLLLVVAIWHWTRPEPHP